MVCDSTYYKTMCMNNLRINALQNRGKNSPFELMCKVTNYF